MNIIEIPDDVKYKLVYKEPFIETPFHKCIKVIFADYTATGRPSPIIDEYINNNIKPKYSNNHSNSQLSSIINTYIDKTYKYFHNKYGHSKNIIFTGNGTTGCINHLSKLLNWNKYNNIYISTLEHHSNFLPWSKISKIYGIKINIIPLDDNGNINLKSLSDNINKNNNNIISITACSNVTGIKTNLDDIKLIAKNNNSLLFVDYACLAPYDNIDLELVDACFISPHKFIGGDSTPGLLIISKLLEINDTPCCPGGGCVISADSKNIIYDTNIEKRETAGTVNIIGIIKLRLIFSIYDEIYDIISINEKNIACYIYDKFRRLNIDIIFENNVNRLPIISFNIKNCHYNFVVKLLSDLFGIQVRGGIMCCGLLSEYINCEGWCRISFHWIMSRMEIDFIIHAIEFIKLYWKEFIYLYDNFDGFFVYNNKEINKNVKSLICKITNN